MRWKGRKKRVKGRRERKKVHGAMNPFFKTLKKEHDKEKRRRIKGCKVGRCKKNYTGRKLRKNTVSRMKRGKLGWWKEKEKQDGGKRRKKRGEGKKREKQGGGKGGMPNKDKREGTISCYCLISRCIQI